MVNIESVAWQRDVSIITFIIYFAKYRYFTMLSSKLNTSNLAGDLKKVYETSPKSTNKNKV